MAAVAASLSCSSGAEQEADCAAPDAPCSACGCAESEYCSANETCMPVMELGEPCTDNAGCVSGNCGEPANGSSSVCLVAIGAPCNDINCNLCLSELSCTTTCLSGKGPSQSPPPDPEAPGLPPLSDPRTACPDGLVCFFGYEELDAIGKACLVPCDGSEDCPDELTCDLDVGACLPSA